MASVVRELMSAPMPGAPARLPWSGELPRRAGAAREGDQVREAAEAFASLLVKELLKTSFSTEATPGMFPRGAAGDLYRDVFLDTMARRVAAADSFPLTAQMARYLRAGDQGIPTSAPGGAANR